MMDFLFDAWNLLSDHTLFVLGAMLLAGYVTGVYAGRIGLPEITGFVLAGVLIGEYGLGLVPRQMSASMKLATELALGIIALTIGSEFSFGKLRRMGRTVAVITGAQLACTFLVVWPVMLWAGLEPPIALLAAAIATASSPAVIVAVAQALRVRGSFVDLLYGVVALLDAGTVVLFGICYSLAAGMMGLVAPDASQWGLAWISIMETVFSVAAGLATGYLMHVILRNRQRPHEVLILALGLVCLTTSAAMAFHLSPLLVNMMAGATLINASQRHYRVFRIIEPSMPPIYALFFVLAGSEMQISIMTQPAVLWIGLLYVGARFIGKIAGTSLGAALVRAPKAAKRHLGWCMLPQAGISLGLVLFIQASPVSENMTPQQVTATERLVNIILFAVFVNQLVGPALTKAALLRGNEMETTS